LLLGVDGALAGGLVARWLFQQLFPVFFRLTSGVGQFLSVRRFVFLLGGVVRNGNMISVAGKYISGEGK